MSIHTIEWPGYPVLIVPRGSQAHGTYVPPDEPVSTDDKDYGAITVMPREYYYGLDTFGMGKGTWEHKEGEVDAVAHEARKAIRLIGKCNPNLVFWLFTPPSGATPAGQLLIDARERFITVELLERMLGYARGEKKRLMRSQEEGGTGQGYMGTKRKRLVEKYGYDTKYASHLVRLARMALEIAKDGEVNVDRTGIDAEQIVAIKQGEWKWNEVIGHTDFIINAVQALIDADEIPLPKHVDWSWLSGLCDTIVASTTS